MNEYVAIKVVGKDNTITLDALPFEVGDSVEVVVQRVQGSEQKPNPTVRDWIESGLIGIWADRDDIGDSVEYARELRKNTWKPRVTLDDPD